MSEQKEKLGQEPAFPQLEVCDEINKRFYAACAAMQGLLSTQAVYNYDIDARWTAKTAFFCADELLKQENEGI